MGSKKVSGFDRKLYAPMILGAILNPVNSSIISVALIPIGAALDAPPSQTAWLISALYLATVIGQPVVGKLIDTKGPRNLYLICSACVGIASLIAFFAPNIWWLVAARVLIGFGTCAGYPSAMYLIHMEGERTGEKSPAGVLTILSIANQTTAVVGPVLGGLLIGISGWQSTFIINLPISIACLILGGIYYPKTNGKSEVGPRLDYIGMGLFSVMMITLLLFLMNPKVSQIFLLIITVAVLAVFAFYELKAAEEPFIPLRLLRGNKPLIATYIRTLLTATAQYSFIYGFAQWLQEGRGLSPSVSGSVSIPMFVVAVLVTGVTGRDPRIFLKLLVGSAACTAAFVLVLLLQDHSSIVFILFIAAVIGIPQGLNYLANQNALYHQASPGQIASSTGLMRTFQYIGAILASAANGVFLHSGAYTGQLHSLAVFQVVISAGLVAVVVLDRSIRKKGNEAKLI